MGFLKDRDGKFSMGHLGAFIVLLMAVAWNVIAMVKFQSLPDGVLPNLASLLGLFTGWTVGTKFTKADKVEEEK